ncbi:hypothetical protein SteCoe_21822 [Stentor coeruleus]|uniref:Uncharacterized protein n=1 Tax=Stentor coeruleus TaxID=5963 RepID=A0A1R2BNJ4_9CILI|nr:hypothetical protein SteCoe_21822 [Stentor coeruleus]
MGACVGAKRKKIEVIPDRHKNSISSTKNDQESERKTSRYLVCKQGVEPLSLKIENEPVLMDPKENPMYQAHKRKLSV